MLTYENACQQRLDMSLESSTPFHPTILWQAFRSLRTRGLLATISRAKVLVGLGTQVDATPRRFAAETRTRRRDDVLNLQPGEMVEVKTEQGIMETLDDKGKNNGLQFMPEMRKYCSQRFKVYKRVEVIILETTGEHRRMKNTVLLEGVICDGSEHHGCDRSCFHYWREAWLKRVE